MSSDDTYELEDIVFVTETEDAILVRCEDVDEEDAETGEDQWWIPKSLIVHRDVHHRGDQGYVEVLEWFAFKEGMA